MGSKALDQWRTTSAALLDEVKDAHKKVGGQKPGRRYATQRLTHAYALLLAAQFQRYCRALHSESYAWILSKQTLTPGVDTTLLAALTSGRALDRNNANAASIAQDFRLLKKDFWKEIDQHNARNSERRKKLELLNEWRNAIAHHDFTKTTANTETLWLKDVDGWRSACGGLAVSIDAVVGDALTALVGTAPW